MRITFSLHLCTILFCFFSINLLAQDAFERTYPAGNHTINGVDVQQTSNGGYLTLSFLIGSDTDSTAAIVTKFNPKGNVDWSKQYRYEEVFEVSHLALLKGDTFAIITSEGLNSQRQVVTKVAPNGDVVWSKAMGNVNILSDEFHSLVYVEETNSLGIFNAVIDNGEQKLNISFLDSLGNIEQSTLYQNNGSSVVVLDAKRTIEQGYLVSGGLDNINSEAFLFNVDSLRNGVWSRSYQGNLPNTNLSFSAVVSTLDSGFLVVGTELILTDAQGFILKVDSLGIPQWGKTLELDELGLSNTILNNIVQSNDGNYVISGQAQTFPFFDSFAFLFKINENGEVLWKNKYNNGRLELKNGLVTTNDDGYAFFGSGVSESSPLAVPYLLKVDVDGVSSCEDTLSFFMDTLVVQVDTLIFETEDINTIEDAAPMVINFNDFQVPILSLDVPPPFCEGEPIEWTFDATTPGAVSYEWSTGETTDTINVTEEGMYTVDVRIETDICYNLCDTAMISTIGPPTVMILDQGNFCVDGSTTLLASFSGGADAIVWNTGETGPAIEVMDAGTYSVTVTNRCGAGEATIVVTQEAPTVMINILVDSLCLGGNTVLTFDSPNANSFIWSDGSVVPTITATAEGTYGISVSNSCGTAEDEVTLNCIFPTDECVGIPNVFTPNNDSVNEDFGAVIKESCASAIRVRVMRIYNRWGQLVFETTSGQNWNGQYENDLSPSDVYIYYIEIENTSEEENGGIRLFKGDVTLVR